MRSDVEVLDTLEAKLRTWTYRGAGSREAYYRVRLMFRMFLTVVVAAAERAAGWDPKP